MSYILVHDVGTTGSKSSVYHVSTKLKLCATAMREYSLHTAPGGIAEQSVDDWWQGITLGTREALEKANIKGCDITATAFSAQMQGLVLVDKKGTPVCPPMSYLDSRAHGEIKRYFYDGFIKIDKWNARKLIRWVWITGAAAASVKDPLWKYLWVRDHEPQLFKKVHAWLDVKDYLVLKATGRFTMGQDSANATFLFDSRPGKLEWHKGLIEEFGVSLAHLPEVVRGTDLVGGLTPQAAQELGLTAGIPVFAGGGDLTMIALGAGGVIPGKTHFYVGTSGWASTTTHVKLTDLTGMAGSILSAQKGLFNYISELETAGRCLEWVKNHLALDEIGVYLEENPAKSKADLEKNLYHYLSQVVEETDAGANGLIFTPWLHGCRSPFEDPHARGMFFNIGLNTKKRHMIRAVLEGVSYHFRWMLETLEKKAPYQKSIVFTGGGAQSSAWAQILADITGRNIEVSENPQFAGTNGTALLVASGLTKKPLSELCTTLTTSKVFAPNRNNKKLYDKQFKVFKELYRANKKLFATLNSSDTDAP